MDFPLFARHQDNAVLFKIHSESYFEEWKRLGGEGTIYLHSEIRATDYSTRVYISDLLASIEKQEIEVISEINFNEVINLS